MSTNSKELQKMQSRNVHNESGASLADKAPSSLFDLQSPMESNRVLDSLQRQTIMRRRSSRSSLNCKEQQSQMREPKDKIPQVEPQSSSTSSSSESAIPHQARPKKWEWIFNQDFYTRVDKFFDEAGLYPIDPKDQLLGIRQFSKIRLSEDDGECNKLSGTKSQAHSPKLISSSPIESKLFQRRLSLSLNPSKIIQRMCDPRATNKTKTLNIKTNNSLLQKIKAIEEVDTPALSRNNSECAASTPKRVDSKQISRILKDLESECKSRGSSANPLVHSTSLGTPELSSKRRCTDEIIPLKGSLKLKTASSLVLPSELSTSERFSRRSKFYQDGHRKHFDDLTLEENKSPNVTVEQDESPPMA